VKTFCRPPSLRAKQKDGLISFIC